MNLDITKLKELPRKNPTSLLVLQDLSKRERMRWETDLDRNAIKLLNKGFKVDQGAYIQTWKDLEALGAGVIIWGRNGNPNRFRWHYSLKDVGAEAISMDEPKPLQPLSEKEKEASQKPKRQYKKRSKRGRPPGSKNKSKPSTTVPVASYEGIVLTVKDLEGNVTTISLEEATKIANQVNKLREFIKVAA